MSDINSLAFATASAAVLTKERGTTLLGLEFPTAVDNSAARVGFEVSFDGGTTYSLVATDVIGTATNYRPAFLISQALILDPTIMYALNAARRIRITFYAIDGTTAASQTAVTLGLILSRIIP